MLDAAHALVTLGSNVERASQLAWDFPDDIMECITQHLVYALYDVLEITNPAMRKMVYNMRLVDRRFEAALHPIMLLLSPVTKYTFPSRFVEGLLLLTQELVAGRIRVPIDAYSSLYITVHEACTAKKSENAHYLYEALRSSLADYGVEGSRYYYPEGVERRGFRRFVSHIFTYINRFHVPRYKLDPVENLFVCP